MLDIKKPNMLVLYAEEIEKVLKKAVRHALLAHKRAGNPIAVWRDNRVVIIPPEEIPVEDPLLSQDQKKTETISE